MTGSDEPPAGSAVPGEIDELEQYVQRRLVKLEATPGFPENKARAFLEEIAYRRLRADFPGAVEAAVGNLRIDWSAADGTDRVTAITRLLGSIGIVLTENGNTRFKSDKVEDYLAACRIAGRHRQGPRWWQRASRKYLSPHREWPWQDHKVALFVVALWWRTAESATRRGLQGLLSRRHRDPNVHFVAELLRRRLVNDEHLRARRSRYFATTSPRASGARTRSPPQR